MDGAGDLFVADPYAGYVVELPAGGGPQFQLPYYGYPFGVAVDASDNIYIADPLFGQVVELAAGTYAQSTIALHTYGSTPLRWPWTLPAMFM